MIYPSFPDFRVVRKSVKADMAIAEFSMSNGCESLSLYVGVTYTQQQANDDASYQEPQTDSAVAIVDAHTSGVYGVQSIALTHQQHTDLNQYLADWAQDLAMSN